MEFYGGYQVYAESGVDLTLLKERLKQSVTERWEDNFRVMEFIEALRKAKHAQRPGDPAAVDRESC